MTGRAVQTGTGQMIHATSDIGKHAGGFHGTSAARVALAGAGDWRSSPVRPNILQVQRYGAAEAQRMAAAWRQPRGPGPADALPLMESCRRAARLLDRLRATPLPARRCWL